MESGCFRERLLQRIGMNDIHEITCLTQKNNIRKQELYELIFDADDRVAYQATWCLTHFSLYENRWLYDKQDLLINEVLVCKHPGKRRLVLDLLYRQPLANPPRIDFLDFCMERMISKDELPGVQSLCMKLAYELCRPIPELQHELRALMEIIEPDMLVPSTRASRKNILKAMQAGKSMQIY